MKHGSRDRVSIADAYLTKPSGFDLEKRKMTRYARILMIAASMAVATAVDSASAQTCDTTFIALNGRLNEFNRYCYGNSFKSVSTITYEHLLSFVADFGLPSVHVKKNRLWALRQFYHFLKLNGIITITLRIYQNMLLQG